MLAALSAATNGAKIAMFGMLAVGAIALYLYINHLQSENDTLAANNTTLKLAVTTQKDTIKALVGAVDEWRDSQKQYQKTMESLVGFTETASTEFKRLNGLFSKHDLEKLAIGKPGLIQRRVNSGTNDNIRLLKDITARGYVNTGGDRKAGQDPGGSDAKKNGTNGSDKVENNNK